MVDTKKYVLSILGIVLLVGLFSLIGISISAGHSQSPKILTYAEVNPVDGTIVGEIATAFKEKTEELSGGSVVIDIQSGGVLGSDDQILDNLMSGGNLTDIARISAFALNLYGCKKATLLGIPYTFEDEDHFWNFAESDLADEFLIEPYELGLPLRGLCYAEEGFRHFFFTKDVKDISDLKNLQIRVSSDPIMTGMVSDLGGYASSVAFTELYSALSTGVVDGAEQPAPNYLSNAFQEVAPTLIKDGHTLGAVQMVISESTWEKLTPEEQEWVQEAAKYAAKKSREKVNEIEDETYSTLESLGTTVVDVPDKTPWKEACESTIKENVGDMTDIYQQILDMK